VDGMSARIAGPVVILRRSRPALRLAWQAHLICVTLVVRHSRQASRLTRRRP
jgi:hypothetical protein